MQLYCKYLSSFPFVGFNQKFCLKFINIIFWLNISNLHQNAAQTGLPAPNRFSRVLPKILKKKNQVDGSEKPGKGAASWTPLLKDPKSAKILELRTQMSLESENDKIFTFLLYTPPPLKISPFLVLPKIF